jgi:hypothetical protein
LENQNRVSFLFPETEAPLFEKLQQKNKKKEVTYRKRFFFKKSDKKSKTRKKQNKRKKLTSGKGAFNFEKRNKGRLFFSLVIFTRLEKALFVCEKTHFSFFPNVT